MKPNARLRSCLAAACSALILSSAAYADTLYFDGGGTTTTGIGWGAPSAWSTDLAGTLDAAAAPTSADDVIFSITGATAGVVGMNSPRAANSLTFNSAVANTLMAHTTTTTANSLTIGAGGVTINSGAGAVTFGVSTRGVLTTTLGVSQLWTNDGANAFSVIQPVDLGANTLTLAGSGAGTTGISGKISGTGGMIMNKTGGAVTLSGANDYSGGFTLSNGRVENVTGAYAGFGSGTLTLNGGNMHFSGSSTIANDMIWNGSFQFSRPGTGTPIVTFNGDATMTGDFAISQSGTQPVSGINFNGDISAATTTRLFTLNGNTATTIAGNITGTVALTKNGTNALIMSGANNYSGLTTVADGTVTMTTPAAIGGLTVASGKTFNYAPTTAGALNVNGAFTLGSAVAANTALGGTLSQSVIAATGAATMSGTGVVNIRLSDGATPAVGTHNLITAASGLTGGTYTLNRVFNNTNFTVSNFTRSATAISVDVASESAITGTVFWKGGLTGSTGVWSATNGSNLSNWQVTDGVNQGLAPGATADLVFSTATTPGTMAGMTLGANMTVRSLTINNTATTFSLNADGFGANNVLTIAPSSSTTGITIGAGVAGPTIAAPISLGADQKWTNNSGNLFSVSGAIATNGNDLEIAGRATITGLITGSGGLTKSGPGTLILSNTSNSYTGQTIVTGGILQDGIAWNNGQGSIPGGEGNATTGSNLELNGGIVALTWFLQRSLGDGPGQVQLTGGRSGFASLTNPRTTWTMGADASYEAVWGALGEGTATGFFNPSTFVMNDAAASPGDAFILANKVDLNGANRTIEAASTVHRGEVSGVIRNSSPTNAAGLIKTGVGELRLSAANTFNGVTTISAGTLNLTNSLALQNSALDTTNSIAGTTSAGLKTDKTALTLGGLIGDKNFDDTAGSVFTTTSGGYGAVTAVTLNVGTGSSHSYSGAIGNGAATTSLTKSGLGTQTLSGDNSYTGATNVNQGTLIINGSTSSTSLVSVAAAGTIGGIGTVGGATTLNGTLSPGQSPGTLTFTSDLTVNGGATYLFESGDLTNVNGTLDLNDNWNLTLSGLGFQDGGSVVLFDYFAIADSPDLTPANINLVGLGFSPSGSLTLTDTGSAIVLNGISAIPEPDFAALIGALGAVLLLRRRR